MNGLTAGNLITLVVIIGGGLIIGGILVTLGIDRFVCDMFWRACYFISDTFWNTVYFIPDRIADWREQRQSIMFEGDDHPLGAADESFSYVPNPAAPPSALIRVDTNTPRQAAIMISEQEAATTQMSAFEIEAAEARKDLAAAYAQLTSEIPVVHEGEIIDPVTAKISQAPAMPVWHHAPVQSESDVDDFITNLKIQTAEFNARLAAWAESGQALELTAGV